MSKPAYEMKNTEHDAGRQLVTVVVPVYRTDLSRYEQVSLRRLLAVLGRYRIVVAKPRSLDAAPLQPYFAAEDRNMETESFDDAFFEGIAGYNRLMMSETFYERFLSSEYVLICQLDAYVFRDELEQWCGKGYDYIGAPWLVRPVYQFPLLRLTSWLKRVYCNLTGTPNGQITRYKVGNGGFSLRRTSNCLRAVSQLHDTAVRHFLTARHHHTFNEDVFFAVEVNRHGLGFRYPDWREALQFAFDKYPALCYRLNGNRLPFGCHSWFKRKMRRFWLPVIIDGQQPNAG